ncbi:CRISPR-associated protein Cas1 [Streptococcus sp. DD11]|uniref:CRISPR-associated endonuclease Cas1 n=1 Tax=Streptococcus sp. DD11 TaxID=1777879 RepID=UPI00079312B1|nr:CRISPR-associated endonuclease Cas1 [Streptococcus sp. DD11]KXT78613.1 CRISPR-associated protein Cas1 [Streptococcus sp. DD11]
MADLYIQNSSYSLSLSDHKLMIKDQDHRMLKVVSLSLIDTVLIFGHSQLSTQLLKSLALQGIPVFYFSAKGEFLFSMDSFREADYEKQRLQAQASFDTDFCLKISQKIAWAKIKNQLNLLKAYDEQGLLDEEDFKRFEGACESIKAAKSISEMMGIEGRTAKSYFYYLNLLVEEDFHFYGRNRRPSLDPFNALLNFGYSILYSCFIGLIRKNGLSLGFGVMHQPRTHHAVLASDLMEEWRPVIVDDTVMGLIKRGEIKRQHFEKAGDETHLTSEGIELFSRAMRERILEIHRYIELDKNRYTFLYMSDQQVKSLIRSFESRDSDDYISSCTGG